MPLGKPRPASDRNFRVRCERLKRSGTVDDGGHIDESASENWETVGSFWVAITTRGSREFFRRDEVAADVTHGFDMLWSPKAATITEKMRFRKGSRIFNIAEPPRNVDEDNYKLIFACIEVQEGR